MFHVSFLTRCLSFLLCVQVSRAFLPVTPSPAFMQSFNQVVNPKAPTRSSLTMNLLTPTPLGGGNENQDENNKLVKNSISRLSTELFASTIDKPTKSATKKKNTATTDDDEIAGMGGGGFFTNSSPETRRVIPEENGRAKFKVVYVVLESQYQSSLTKACTSINDKQDGVCVECVGYLLEELRNPETLKQFENCATTATTTNRSPTN